MGGKSLDSMWAGYLSMQACGVCVLGDGGVECEDDSERCVMGQEASLSILGNPLAKRVIDEVGGWGRRRRKKEREQDKVIRLS